MTAEKIHLTVGETVEEERYFPSSLPATRLSTSQWMKVIRGHWAIENNCHNTWDTAFIEDRHPWIDPLCQPE